MYKCMPNTTEQPNTSMYTENEVSSMMIDGITFNLHHVTCILIFLTPVVNISTVYWQDPWVWGSRGDCTRLDSILQTENCFHVLVTDWLIQCQSCRFRHTIKNWFLTTWVIHMQSICIERAYVQIRQTLRFSVPFPIDKLCHMEGNYNYLHGYLLNVNTNSEGSLLLLQISYQFQFLHLLKTASLRVYRCIYVCVYRYIDR